MKRISPPLLISIILLLAAGCTSQKKLAYLNNLPEPDGQEYFSMEVPDYKIQNRDILYITVKAMNPDGQIIDFIGGGGASSGAISMQGESAGYLLGYDVKPNGRIFVPVIGEIMAEGKTLEEMRIILQEQFSHYYKNATVECKLLSFKYTVIGEVKAPGSYINYNNHLTILEALGRAGGVSDYGNRDRVLVVRPVDRGTKTYTLNIQDKSILSSEAYYLLPNDIVIVEPGKQKTLSMNLQTFSPIFSSVLTAISTTILLLKFFEK